MDRQCRGGRSREQLRAEHGHRHLCRRHHASRGGDQPDYCQRDGPERHCDNGRLPRWPDHAFRPDFRLWRADQGRPRRPDPLGALDVFRPDRRPGGVPCGWRHQRVFGRKRVHGGGARNHLRQPERLQPDHRLAGGRRGSEQQHRRRSRDADHRGQQHVDDLQRHHQGRRSAVGADQDGQRHVHALRRQHLFRRHDDRGRLDQLQCGEQFRHRPDPAQRRRPAMGGGHLDRHLLPPRRLRRVGSDLRHQRQHRHARLHPLRYRGGTKTGRGPPVLAGTDTYSGPTTVAAGTLTVNGSIANSAVTVNSGAMLSGTGTVGGLTINGGATFAPGNSPGTMTVQGNLAFQSGAIYLVQVNSTTASNTVVSGSATLAGTVQAAFASGSYATRMYTILSAAGGLGGTTFNALTTSNLPAGFTASLSYTATDAILNLTATLGQLASGPGAPSGPSALACAFSGNQCNVANAINAFFNNGGALPPNFLALFNLTGANLANALTLLSGEAATGAQQGAFQLGNQFLGIMLDPFVDGRSNPLGGGAIGFAPERAELPDDIALAYAKILKAPPKPPSFEQRWSAWGAGYGGSNRTSGDPAVVGSHDLSATTAGGAAGLDYRLAPGTVVGFALAGGGTNWGLAQGLGTGKSDAFQAGIYGTARSGSA